MTIVYFSDAADGDCGLGGFEGNRRDRALANRKRLLRRFNIASPHLVTAVPSSDGKITWIEDLPLSEADRPEAECLVTRRKDIAIGIHARDCLPIMFENASQEIVAAVHASRENFTSQFIETVLMTINPHSDGKIEAHLGPCLQFSSHELGLDVAERFVKYRPDSAEFFTIYPDKPGKAYLDYSNYTARLLERYGVHIAYQSDEDTLSDMRYFSRRRLGDKPDINISFIAMNPALT